MVANVNKRIFSWFHQRVLPLSTYMDMLNKIKVDGKTNYILLCCALLLGRWLPQIPLHLFFFLDTIYDVYMLVLTATAIMLAAFCQHDKRFSTYLLSFAIIIIMTIPIHHKWIRAIDLKMGLAVME